MRLECTTFACDGPPPVVVGCSGGADSTALLALAVDAALAPVAVHVDHGLRSGSAHEADLVAAVAERLGAEFRSVRVTIAPGPNLEARARDARYHALEQARLADGASTVLVGHTADDQAETVLLNVLRGAATTGLAGMPATRDRIARPLLGWRRADTRALCEARGLPVLDDPMNHDGTFRRVAIRHEVMPLLERIAGRDLTPVLARQAALLREETEFLDALAVAAWPGPDGCADTAALRALPPVLARRALRNWLGAPSTGPAASSSSRGRFQRRLSRG